MSEDIDIGRAAELPADGHGDEAAKGPVMAGESNKMKLRFFGGAVAGEVCPGSAPSVGTGLMECRRESG
jgi:hypothetical protein